MLVLIVLPLVAMTVVLTLLGAPRRRIDFSDIWTRNQVSPSSRRPELEQYLWLQDFLEHPIFQSVKSICVT